MGILQENYVLENGVKIPKIGFGTWQISDGDEAYNAVSFALKSGYTHIDTARAYGNEPSVGRAVRDSGMKREDIFITTKLPAEIKNYGEAHKSFETTMDALDLGYVDLYLIHAPWPWGEMGADYSAQNKEVWKAMEEIYATDKCRSIGVSNFNVNDLELLKETWTVKPMANQIRFFIGETREDVTQYCQDNNILVESYSPLATGKILENPDIEKIAGKYGKTIPQICIRYVLQRGTLALPKSVHEEYIVQNADVDFEIDAADMKYLDGLKNTA